VILVNNDRAESYNSDNISDNDPATTITLNSGTAVLYGDLQEASTPGCLVINGNPGFTPVGVGAVLEVSSDLENWSTVLAGGDGVVTIPKSIPLPDGLTPWRYFKLTITSEKNIVLSEVGISEGECSQR
jgi:hypothetical protein